MFIQQRGLLKAPNSGTYNPLSYSSEPGIESGIGLSLMLIPPAGGVFGGLGAASEVSVGTKVYRVYGDASKPFGASWTKINPSTVSNYRNAAGLPAGGWDE